MSLGPVMVDLAGPALAPEERARLLHPLVGGVILFARNYESPEQVRELVAQIHALREPQLLVAVDQEGGRVQRFRDGFTALPPVARLGEVYDENRKLGRRLAELSGWLMAAELRAVGIDFSFAPVLDLDRGICPVIGDRAFHADPEAVAELARAYMNGMQRAGMAATGKHFPGHGAVTADSHVSVPVDERDYVDIEQSDLPPFERLIHANLAAVMTAHVLYPRVDRHAPAFSTFWLQEVLRRRLEFSGVIFSDDLSMAGAAPAGDVVTRAQAALAAGCDMILVCNDPAAAEQVLAGIAGYCADPVMHLRLARMHGRHAIERAQLAQDAAWQQAVRAVQNYA